MKTFIFSLTFALAISYQTEFDPVETIVKACNLQPYVACPHCWRNDEVEKTAIHLQIQVQRFINLDDVDESFEFTGVLIIFWMDDCLRNTYNNRSVWKNQRVTSLYFTDADTVWTPDIIHLNSLSNSAFKKGNFEFRTYLNLTAGMSTTAVYGSFKSHCDLNFSHFPFDRQSCQFTLLIGTNVDSIAIVSMNAMLDHEAIPDNSNWNMTHLSFFGHLNSKTPIATMVTNLARNPAYFIFNLFIPSIVLSILEMFSFFIPAYCGGDRPSFAATILLSMYLIHTQVLTHIPKTPKPVVISSYVLGIIGHAMTCSIYSALSSWLAHYHAHIFERKIRIGMRKITIMSLVDAIAFSIALVTFVIMNFYVLSSIGAFNREQQHNSTIAYSPFFG